MPGCLDAADLLARLPSFSLQLHPLPFPFLSSNRVNRTDNASPTLFSRSSPLPPFLSYPSPFQKRFRDKNRSRSRDRPSIIYFYFRLSKFGNFPPLHSFFFTSSFLASPNFLRQTSEEHLEARKKREGNRLRSSAQHLGSTV